MQYDRTNFIETKTYNDKILNNNNNYLYDLPRIRSNKFNNKIIEKKFPNNFDDKNKLKLLKITNSSYSKNSFNSIYALNQNNMTFLTKINKAARILQKFFIYLKLKNRFTNSNNIMVNILKGCNWLQNKILKNLYKFVFTKITKEVSRRILIKFVVFLRNKKLKNFYYAFRRMKHFVEVKTFVLNTCAKRIQDRFKTLKIRAMFMKFIRQIRKMRNLNNLLVKKILNIYFDFWRKDTIFNIINRDATVIQKFVRKNMIRLKNQQKAILYNNMKILFKKYFIVKHFNPFIKILKRLLIFNKAFHYISRFYFKNFHKNINQFFIEKRNQKFKKIINDRISDIKNDLLRVFKNFYILKIKSESVNKIKRCFLLFKLRKRNKNIKLKLNNFFDNLCNKNRNLLIIYFKKWVKFNFNYQIIIAVTKINTFMKDTNLKLKSYKNWIKLKNRVKLKSLIKMLKNLKFIDKITIIYNDFKKDKINHTMKIFKNNFISSKINLKLSKIIHNYNNKQNYSDKKLVLKNWNNITQKIKTKENSCIRIFESIASNKFYSKLILLTLKFNKLHQIYKKITLQNIFNKINQKSENIKILKYKFSNSLIRFEKIVQKDLITISIDKIYKIYIFKILSSIFNKLFIKFKKNNSIDFLNNLITNIVKKSQKSYKSEFNFTSEFHKTRISYNGVNLSKKNKLILMMSHRDYKIYTVPHIFKTLSKIRENNFIIFINKLKIIRKGKRIKEALENKINSILPYKSFFEKIKYKIKTPILIKQLKSIMRKFILNKITKDANKVKRIVNLMNLLKITIIHKKLANRKFLRSLLRGWLFHAHMRKITIKKMTSLYKSMKLTYLKTAEDIFIDEKEHEDIELLNEENMIEFEKYNNFNIK